MIYLHSYQQVSSVIMTDDLFFLFYFYMFLAFIIIYNYYYLYVKYDQDSHVTCLDRIILEQIQ